jgi:hypothetical protein
MPIALAMLPNAATPATFLMASTPFSQDIPATTTIFSNGGQTFTGTAISFIEIDPKPGLQVPEIFRKLEGNLHLRSVHSCCVPIRGESPFKSIAVTELLCPDLGKSGPLLMDIKIKT